MSNLFFKSQILALDSNIFISAFNAYENTNSLGNKAQEILKEIKQIGSQVFISVLVFEEFLVYFYKDDLVKDIGYHEGFITGGGLFTVKDVDKQVARRAAWIRAKYPSIRTPDAIHIASAIEVSAELFITADKGLPKKIGKLKIHTLGNLKI